MNSKEQYHPPNEMPSFPDTPVLQGQKAIVTGASKGLGSAIAIGLARSGADVIVNYYTDKEGAEETAEEIEKTGRKALIYYADVAEEQQVQDMFRLCLKEFGRLDICVPNAGIQMNAPIADMTAEQWRRVIDVNLTGQFFCAREAIRMFTNQGLHPDISSSAGKLIFMSSIHDIVPWEGHVNYASSKGGIMLLMKSIAQEVAHLRIRANAVSPGAIRTPMNVEKITSQEIFDSTLLRLIPYKRIGEPEDVARAVVWLASDASDYVTGSTIYIDGGMNLYPGFIGGG
ncbi:MAG: glucose 1-dehydrogenase [Spirochaetales bacterium]|nr:glucose 1-dehydrogenase [Spirochaetales bacterium]